MVITDIRMPEMDGLEMLERALAVYSFRIILLTSYADFDYARRAISLRACDYLLKPLDEEKLDARLVRELSENANKDMQKLASLMSRIHSEEETAKQMRRLMPLLNSTCKSASLVMEEIREQDAYVDVALERIATHSEQRLRIETLAEEMGVSASYLSRRFKAVTGQTFLDTLNMQRVQQAVGLLHEGARTSEVAEKTGFTDYKHFCSVFKRCTGLTPREYLRGSTAHSGAAAADNQKG